jgi:DNA-binding IclR family transcriptional regulator
MVEDLIARGLESITPRTITDPIQLRENLATIRRQGWAYTLGELTPGVAAVAVPLLDSNGTLVAALSIAGPVSRFSEDKLTMLRSATERAAEDISGQLVAWHRAPENTQLLG